MAKFNAKNSFLNGAVSALGGVAALALAGGVVALIWGKPDEEEGEKKTQINAETVVVDPGGAASVQGVAANAPTMSDPLPSASGCGCGGTIE